MRPILKIKDKNGNIIPILAIKGEKGDKGDKGADGTMTFSDLTEEQKASLKGDKGEKGNDGLTPYIGENGHWWIGETDTGVIAPATFRYEKGSYEGTGVYGKDNPNSLTFSFEPKLVIITNERGRYQMILINGVPLGYNWYADEYRFEDSKVFENKVVWEGCSVRWHYHLGYGDNTGYSQLNGKYIAHRDVVNEETGETTSQGYYVPDIFHYVAIG